MNNVLKIVVVILTPFVVFSYVLMEFFIMGEVQYLRDIQKVIEPGDDPYSIYLSAIILLFVINGIVILFVILLNKSVGINGKFAFVCIVLILLSFIWNLFSFLIFTLIEDELVYSEYILTIGRLTILSKIIVMILIIVFYKLSKNCINKAI